MAPIKSDGANIPPEPPEPMVTVVAIILAKIRIRSRPAEIEPVRAGLIVS